MTKKNTEIVKSSKQTFVEKAFQSSLIETFFKPFTYAFVTIMSAIKGDKEPEVSDEELDLIREKRIIRQTQEAKDEFLSFRNRVDYYIKFFKDTEYEEKFDKIKLLMNDIYRKIDDKNLDYHKIQQLNNYYLSNFENLFELVLSKIEDEKFEFYKKIELKKREEDKIRLKKEEEERKRKLVEEEKKKQLFAKEEAEKKRANEIAERKKEFYKKKNLFKELTQASRVIKSDNQFYDPFKIDNDSISRLFSFFNYKKKESYCKYIKSILNLNFDFDFITHSTEDDLMIFKSKTHGKYFTIDTDNAKLKELPKGYNFDIPTKKSVKITDKKVAVFTQSIDDDYDFGRFDKETHTPKIINTLEPLILDSKASISNIKELCVFLSVNYGIKNIQNYYGNDQDGNMLFRISNDNSTRTLDIKLDFRNKTIGVVDILNKEDYKKENNFETHDIKHHNHELRRGSYYKYNNHLRW